MLFLLPLLLLFSPHSAHATLQNGEPAEDILGQFSTPSTDTTANYTGGCVNNGPSPLGFNTLDDGENPPADGIALDSTNHRLFVSDYWNNRVLVFTLTSGNLLSSKTATYVLGQPNMGTCAYSGTPSSSNMNNPMGLAFDAGNNRLFVADENNNRVLVFNTTTITNGMAASNELGQPNATAFTSNGAATSQSGLGLSNELAAADLAFDSVHDYLYVVDGGDNFNADNGNNRVMVFNVAPGFTNGENALYEIGQPSGVNAFTTNGAALSQSGFNGPSGVAVDTTNSLVYVSDSYNCRVLVFPEPSANGENASYVLGEPDFTTASCGGPTQALLGQVTDGGEQTVGTAGIAVDPANSRVFVSDFWNNRVLIFPTPVSNGENASYVLGQQDFVSADGSTTQSLLNSPLGLAYDSTNNQLYVMDSSNSRVVLFDTSTTLSTASLPTQSGDDACAIAGGGPASGLVGWWRLFDGSGTSAADSSGNSNTGTLENTPTWVATGPHGGGLTLNGTSQYVNVPYNSVLNVTGSYTVSAWVYATTLSGSSGTQTIWDNNPATSNGDIILQFNNNTLAFGFYNTGGTATLVTTSATYSAGTWYHVVGVYNQSTPLLSIYVNGALATSGTPSGTPHGNTNADTIGESSWGGQYFGGTIDDVRIYNVALTAAQVWQMYNTGSNLFCWGYNVDQEDGTGNGGAGYQHVFPQPVGDAANWTAVSQADPTYDFAACGIAGGSLYCWGNNNSGELGLGNTTQYGSPQQVTSPSGTWTVISQGGQDACGIDSGNLYCWGLNEYGEDGLGNATQYETPQQVLPTISGLTAYWPFTEGSGTTTADATGNGHTGTLYGSPAWATSGPNGHGLTFSSSSTYVEISADLLTGAIPFTISAWIYPTALPGSGFGQILGDGETNCWYYTNSYGNLIDCSNANGGGNANSGNGGIQFNQWTFVTATRTSAGVWNIYINGVLSGAANQSGGSLTAGSGHTYIGAQSGYNFNGTIAEVRLYNSVLSAAQVAELYSNAYSATWSTVSQGNTDACGIAGGELYCWGYNGYGEDGINTTTQQETPQQVGIPSAALNWTAVTQSGNDACGIASGQLYCWGANSYGEDGFNGRTPSPYTPLQVTGISTTWSVISQADPTFDKDACGITTAGALYCWGQNTYGTAGQGNTTNYTMPTQVTSPSTTWSTVSVSGNDACAITTGNALYCWGRNEYGELGIGNTTEKNSPQQVTYTPGLTTNLVGWWKLTDGSGTTAADSSGYGNTGNLQNTPTWATGGPNGDGLTLNGTSQYVSMGEPASLALSGSWTISTWVNLSALPASGGQYVLIAKETGSGGNYYLTLDNNNVGTGGLGWIVNYNSTGCCDNHYAEYNTSPSTGTWYLVTGVYSSSAQTLTLYVNGSQVATASMTGYPPESANGGAFSLGYDSGNYLAGSLDDTRVYNTALNSTQVSALYTANTATAWSAVSTGGFNTCAITTAGALYCWGEDKYGEAGQSATVFISSGTSNGALGASSTLAISNANALCNGSSGGATTTSSLAPNGTYLAWIAAGTGTGPSSTYEVSVIPYADVYGHVIASNFTGLSSTLLYGISYTELGGTQLTSGNVWTNVTDAGASANTTSSTSKNCSFWTVGVSGDKGDTGAIDSTSVASGGWTTKTTPSVTCNTAEQLLCFQQAGGSALTTPVQVGSATNWTVISQGGYDTCGIAGGKLYCWGENAYGEVGQGGTNTTPYASPQQVGALTTWSAVTVQYDGTNDGEACGIAGGALYCWGRNNHYEDGNSTTTETYAPVQVGSATTWSTVSFGAYDVCATTTAYALYCWGYNYYGEDGLGNDNNNQETPQLVPTLYNYTYATNWSVVSQGAYDTCGIAGGALYCWGLNYSGELGLGNTTEYNTPQQVTSPSGTWTAISIQDVPGPNNNNACGIASGALYCWGDNYYGEDGLGNTTPYETPQHVTSPSGTWTAVSFGGWDTCGIDNSELYCWGYNDYGEDGLGTTSENTTPQLVSLGNLDTANAIDELGQYTTPAGATNSWTQWGPNNGPTALGLDGPYGTALDTTNHYLYVVDSNNSRVLVYTLNTDNSIPTSSGGHTATYVLGQMSLQGANMGGGSMSQLNYPTGIAFDAVNNRLFVSDYGNSRVLVYNVSGGVTTGMSASNYIGGCYGTTRACLEGVSGVAYDAVNSRLFVADNENSRILVFNVAPGFSNGENASYVLGQANFTSGNANRGGSPAQNTLANPNDIVYDATNSRLFVGDDQNRVMVFNVAPTYLSGGTGGTCSSPTYGNGEKACYVLGETDFTTVSGLSGQALVGQSAGLGYDPNANRLFVASLYSDILSVFNVGPSQISNGMNASYEIGCTSFTAGCGGTTQSTLDLPIRAFYDPGSGRLFVGDAGNNRLMIFGADFMPSWPADIP